ncbi:RDD family protein [Flavobacterium ustbae]|uniref:RDD family protein n=1 Tax=Flavobacterium ustbae TaxID=2488790 RepID=UPI000F787FC0|nr:RDD family protein [Flavobacterium ustbae]
MSNSTYVLDDTLLVSAGARFVHYIVDVIIFFIIMVVLGTIIGIMSALFGTNSFANSADSSNELVLNIISIIILIIYYTVMEGLFGRSVGKFLTGSVVVDENGEKPDFGTILKRSLCRLIPFDAFTFLGGSRGWHDSISNTYVVDKKGLDESKKIFHDFKLIGVQELE